MLKTYLECFQTSNMELFIKIVNDWKLLTVFTKSHLSCFTKFLIRLWMQISWLVLYDKKCGPFTVKSLNIYRSNHQTCSIKKVILNKIFQNFQENTCVGVSFLMKLLALGLQFCWKRDSETGVFIWILKIFKISFL